MDTFSFTTLEAALFKKPIIASNIGGIPEISDKINFTDNTINDIYQKMLKVYESKETKVEYPNIEKFSLETMTKEFIKLYKEIIKP